MNKNLSWIKDTLIQIVFIIIAIVFTVLIAHTGISAEYTSYYRSRLTEKAESIAHSTARMLSEVYSDRTPEAHEIGIAMEVLLSVHSDIEIVSYALYGSNGQAIATTEGFSPMPTGEAINTPNTKLEETSVSTYYPFTMSGDTEHVLLLNIDYSPFSIFSDTLETTLHTSLMWGCLIMALSYIIFSVFLNLIKTKTKTQTDILQKLLQAPKHRMKTPKTSREC